MHATCDHCGHRNEVPDSAINSEVLCERCKQEFFALSAEEAAANRRASKILLAAVLLLFCVFVFLLFAPKRSGVLRSARHAVFGNGIAKVVGGDAGGGGEREGPGGTGNATSPLGGELPDAQATNSVRRPDQSIGRLPQTFGARRAGDEVRAGAAGTDDPAGRVGNSPTGGVQTPAPSAGGNPGNSDRRNSVETPQGHDLLTGNSVGADAGGIASTNGRSNALLLDDFSERLRQAGARSGDIQISLEWKNVNDLDLHVIDPAGEEIFYGHRESGSGGILDVDMNARQLTQRPVENVYWPERGAPRGRYTVDVVHFRNQGAPDPTPFSLRVVNKGQPTYYRGTVTYGHSEFRSRVRVCTFTVQ